MGYLAYMRTARKAAKLGPQGMLVCQVLSRASTLTQEECANLTAASEYVLSAERLDKVFMLESDWVNANLPRPCEPSDPMRDPETRLLKELKSLDAKSSEGRTVTVDNCVFYAVWALAFRHQVATGQWEVRQYDALSWFWRTTIGPIHPDDPEFKFTPDQRSVWLMIARSSPDLLLGEAATLAQAAA